MKARPVVSALSAAIIVLMLAACAGSTSEPDRGHSEATARLVTHMTSGEISTSTPVRIVFREEMVPSGMVGEPAVGLVELEPRIDGLWVWESTQALIFRNEEPLPLKTEFQGTLDLARAVDEANLDIDAEIEPAIFQFATLGRELTQYVGDFQLVNSNDPSAMIYVAEMEFNDPPPIDQLNRALSVRYDNNEIDYELTPAEEDGRYSLRTDAVRRDNREHTLVVEIREQPIELTGELRRVVDVPPLERFEVQEVSARTEGSETALQIVFSDELSATQDLTGLIRTEPAVELRFRKANRTVIATGDFQLGEEYRVIVSSGVHSVWGTRIDQNVSQVVEMAAIKPAIEFVSKGVFLPTTGDGKIHFKSVNVREVRIEVQQVFDNNLGQFLQTERLASTAERNSGFNSQYVHRVGVEVASETLEIGEQENIWLVHEVDISSLLGEEPRGLFLIRLWFERDDMIWDHPAGRNRYYGSDYYTNPSSYGYLRANGNIYKPVIVSNIGLTWKLTGEEHVVVATDVLTGEPANNVDVSLMTYQNQLVASGRTNNQGMVRLPRDSQEVFYLTGSRGEQRSVIKANEMGWNLSTFDTGGEQTTDEGVQAFIYTERGVHRPGDDIHLAAIVRNQDNTFPRNHPIDIKLVNPRGQTYLEDTLTESVDGFYSYTIKTEESDPTGTWRFELEAGDGTFTHKLPIETIVPNRLDVQVASDPRQLGPADRTVNAEIFARYLFGASAAGLEYELEARLRHREKKSSQFPGFTFSTNTIDYSPITEQIGSGRLNEAGEVSAAYSLPVVDTVPSALDLVINARVLEPGGRATTGNSVVGVDPYTHYAGFEMPEMRYGYARIGQPLQVPVITVDTDGEAVAGRELEYRLYRNRRWWWWHYDSYDEFRIRYKSSVNTELLTSGTVASASRPNVVSVTPDSWGQYLLEIEDKGSGHIAGFFFRGSSWTSAQPGYDEGVLGLSADRESYGPGDTAVIRAATPADSRMLVTVEKANQILETRWVDTVAGETSFEVDITEEMLPNIYVSVSLQQPHAQTANDRPVRMYGIIPIRVTDPETVQNVEITTASRLEPNEEFTVEVQTTDGEPTQFTVAVVDEGLLNITDFKTPNPWETFFAKQRLNIQTYDQYGQIIGAMNDDVFRTFSIGGGDGELGPDDSDTDRRFEPVALFTGPMMTDSSGHAEVTFDMPNYMGEVRIMVIHARENRYGSASVQVPVTEDIVMLPTLPRVLGPGESIVLPVNLFSTVAGDQETTLTVETTGPVSVTGDTERRLALPGMGSASAEFALDVGDAVGPAVITLRARSGRTVVETRTNIQVRASSPVLSVDAEDTVDRGRATALRIPEDALAGTEEVTLSISRRPNLNLQDRLNYLIRYPYGCLEQTVSAGFPQLYLSDFLPTEENDYTIDRAIEATIDRLRRMQLPNGGFGFWAGSDSANLWGTNYAGHFLLVAKERGYAVPNNMIENWIRFQNSRAIGEPDHRLTNTYRLYLLALAGAPAVGPMNIALENGMGSMSDTEKWLLAAAYTLAGMDDQSRTILRQTGTATSPYDEFGRTYGSRLRDRAMILDAAVIIGRRDVADQLFEQIAENLSERNWYSTHTVGYGLLALGHYIDEMVGSDDQPLRGSVALPNGRSIDFDSDDLVHTVDVTDELYGTGSVGKGDAIRVELDRRSQERAYISMHWRGQPAVYLGEDSEENMSLSVVFYNEVGQTIDPRSIEQGEQFWLRVTSGTQTRHYNALHDLAVTQIIPSGWEVVNTRLTNEQAPSWMRRFDLGRETYTDIRDDRIHWFFDVTWSNRELDFVVKLQAVTEGEFILPPTTAESMYDNEYKAMVAGREVVVRGRE